MGGLPGVIAMRRRRSAGSRIFDVSNVILLGLVSLIMVLPFLQVVISSFASQELLVGNNFLLIPSRWSLKGYRYIFSSTTIVRALGVSVCVTAVGTAARIIMQSMLAFPLAHQRLRGRAPIQFLIILTLMFNGGMIPTYIVVQKLGLMNSYLALILPVLMSAYSVIVFKNFFQAIPLELEEAAKVDGLNDLQILFRIIMPVSKPLIASFIVMFGVVFWNSWFDSLLYLDNAKMWPIQMVLRQVYFASSQIGDTTGTGMSAEVLPKTVQVCTIVVATAPILLVYPFMTRHFAKGLIIGSVKG
jgi:putative aldouronate transport system permease protein